MFERFIGQKYSDVMDIMREEAAEHGWGVMSWPFTAAGVSADDGYVIAFITNDNDQQIVRIAVPSEDLS